MIASSATVYMVNHSTMWMRLCVTFEVECKNYFLEDSQYFYVIVDYLNDLR